MILRHHGLLTTGRTVDDAFYQMYYLEQACRLQGTIRPWSHFLASISRRASSMAVGELRRHIPSAMSKTSSATV
jgi:ribulose-5-phosphate 4-epimerase/fuculose-1-phosphate aldolase